MNTFGRAFFLASLISACACGGLNAPPQVAACMELESLTIPLCEAVSASNPVRIDCHARFFGSMTVTCDDATAIRDMGAFESDCLPVMRQATPHYFSHGGGWYDWPAACREQFILIDGINFPR